MSRNPTLLISRLGACSTVPSGLCQFGATHVCRTGADDQQVEVEVKLDAVTHVGKRAMQDVALVTQVEQQLSHWCHWRIPELQAIGDVTAMASAEIVMTTARKLGRL